MIAELPYENVFAKMASLWIQRGSIGVDMFFVLSGFLFTVIIGDKPVVYHKFLYNRALRIFPLLFLVVLIIMATQGRQLNTDFFWYLLTFSYLPNEFRSINYMWAMWTIGTEFKFYFLVPLILHILYKRGVKTILGWILILIICILIFVAYCENKGITNINSLLYHTFLGRFNQFLVGMVFGYYYSKEKFSFCEKNTIITNIALILFLGVLTAYFWSIKFIGGYSIFTILRYTIQAILMGILIILYMYSDIFKCFNKQLMWLGGLTYSIYLFHIPIMLALHHGFPSLTTVMKILLVVPSIMIFAILTKKFIEDPFLDMKVKYFK